MESGRRDGGFPAGIGPYYGDKSTRERSYNSSAVNKVVLHGKEAGYYMAVPYSEPVPPVTYIDPGYWYSVMGDEDRPMNTRLTLKANCRY